MHKIKHNFLKTYKNSPPNVSKRRLLKCQNVTVVGRMIQFTSTPSQLQHFLTLRVCSFFSLKTENAKCKCWYNFASGLCSQWGTILSQPIKGMGKLFTFTVVHFWQGCYFQKVKQKVTKVVLFRKNGEKNIDVYRCTYALSEFCF